PMSSRLVHPVAVLAVLWYTLASTFSGLWHTHPEPLAAHSPQLVSSGDAHVGLDAEHDHDDTCVVCRFVAQSSLPHVPLDPPSSGDRTHDLGRVAPLIFSASVPDDCLARAPPAVG